MTTNDQIATRRCLSVTEAVNALGVCRSSINKMIRTGELASVKLGARRLIPATAIDALIQRKLDSAHGEYNDS